MYSPSLPEFLKLAAKGNLIPVTRRLLADMETPVSAYRKIRGQGEAFLFESVEGGEHIGRYSFVGCNPRGVLRQVDDRVEYLENGRVKAEYRVARGAAGSNSVHDGLEAVEKLLAQYRPVPLPFLPRFTGGAVGFIGYEFIHDVERVVPRPKSDLLQTPTLYFLITDELLIFDRASQTLTILANALIEPGSDPAAAYDKAVAQIERLVALLDRPSAQHSVTLPLEWPHVPFESNLSRGSSWPMWQEAKKYITAGDIIQIVRVTAVFHGCYGQSARRLPRGAHDQSLALYVPARTGRVLPGGSFPGNPCPVRRAAR